MEYKENNTCDCHEHGHECHHEHAHSHDDNHEHAHIHDNGHEHKHSDSSGGSFLTVNSHEASVVASYRFEIMGSIDEAKEKLIRFSKAIASKVVELGGFIGHIKAIVREEGAGLHVSLTEGEPNVTPITSQKNTVEGVAIVFGVEESELKSIVSDAMSCC